MVRSDQTGRAWYSLGLSEGMYNAICDYLCDADSSSVGDALSGLGGDVYVASGTIGGVSDAEAFETTGSIDGLAGVTADAEDIGGHYLLDEAGCQSVGNIVMTGDVTATLTGAMDGGSL